MESSVSRVCSLRDYRSRNEAPLHDDASSPAIAWTHVPDRGRGLIACTDLEPGTILDVAPAIAVKDEDCGGTFRPYVFMCYRADCPQSYTGPVQQALVFGPMSLCNHSDEPNAIVCFEQHAERGLEARLIIQHRVQKGEEVTIRYTDSSWYRDSGLF